MTWEDRLKEAAYTSPGGDRFTFYYENVSKSFSKKTTAFNFPDVDGTYIQDMGRTGRRLPMRFIFWGSNCDLEADNFELALSETGVGTLEHPMYGSIQVVPFGAITRRDDLKNAANQVTIQCTLYETTDVIFPTADGDASSAVAEAITIFEETGATTYETDLSFGSKVEQALNKNVYTKQLDKIKVGLQAAADAQADTQKAFDAVYNSINDSIDTLVGDPLTLAFQTSIMAGTPARSNALIQDKLDAYGNLAQDIFGLDTKDAGTGSANTNEFITNYLYASNLVVGAASSAVNNQFELKTDALSTADYLLNLFEDLGTWQDANLESLETVDTGETYQAVLRVIGLVAGFLVEISFTLLQEKKITLDRDRNYVELVAELYGDISDEKQNFDSGILFQTPHLVNGRWSDRAPIGKAIIAVWSTSAAS